MRALGNSLPVGSAQQTTENYLKVRVVHKGICYAFLSLHIKYHRGQNYYKTHHSKNFRGNSFSEMTAAVLARMGLAVEMGHLCESDCGQLCKGRAPCPTCDFKPAYKPWNEFFDWFYVRMMMCAQQRPSMEDAWWGYFGLPDIQELPRELPPIQDNRPGSRPPPPSIPKGKASSPCGKIPAET